MIQLQCTPTRTFRQAQPGDRWLRRHPNVPFPFTPTHASWLDQIEIWFSIMTRAVLNRLHHPRQICQAIDAFIEVYNPEAAPFEWRKESVHQSPAQTTLRICLRQPL